MSRELKLASTVKMPVSLSSLKRLAESVLRAEKVTRARFSITMVGRRRIRSLNREYLNRDATTDVIAFAFSIPRSPDPTLLADIYICPEVAERNARCIGIRPSEELQRLVVHGVLHVLGHDHPNGDARTASPMWRRQETYLARFAK